jgi:hypothetical protein
MRTGQRFVAALALFAVLVIFVGAAGAAYVDHGDGTVTDTATGLMWQQADDGQRRTWQNALSYCEALDLAGRRDWRLADVRELRSILDYGRFDPSINPAFVCLSSSYWSGSTVAGGPDSAWKVSFDSGYMIGFPKNHPYYLAYVRCVRGGPSGGHLDITHPDGGELLIKGQNYTITWTSRNVTGTVQIDLYNGGRASEQFLRQIAGAAPDTGGYSFTPPNDVPNGNYYLVRISANDGSLQDFSRAFFTITDRPANATRSEPWNLLLLLNE